MKGELILEGLKESADLSHLPKGNYVVREVGSKDTELIIKK